MKKITRLKKEAHESATWRGHEIDWGHIYHGEGRSLRAGSCRKCGRAVMVNTNPPPNGIDIGGEAIALDCAK